MTIAVKLQNSLNVIWSQPNLFQIYRDRKVFSSRVFEVASTDLAGMGIVVISYTIKEVSDEVGYLKVKLTGGQVLNPGGKISFGILLVLWLAELAHDWVFQGLIPLTHKLFHEDLPI